MGTVVMRSGDMIMFDRQYYGDSYLVYRLGNDAPVVGESSIKLLLVVSIEERVTYVNITVLHPEFGLVDVVGNIARNKWKVV